MSFLQPAFLWGLLALAIPVIIHLFHFRKAKKVYFSNTQFLQSVKKISQSKLRLKHYLVLAARLLFVLFLVITFAQPFIPASIGLEGSRWVDIYVDNSYSMSNKVEEDLSGLDAAVQTTNELIAAYPAGTRFRLLTNHFAASSQGYTSAETLSDRLTEIEFSSISRDGSEVLERLKVLPPEAGREERDVFLISDFQAHNWSSEGITALQDSLQQLFLLPLAFQNAANVFVDTVYLEKPVVFSASDNTLHAVLANTGDNEIENKQVNLSVNGLQVASGSISIPAKGQAAISFQMAFPLQESNQGVLSFQDFPLTFDNEFYFVIRQAGKVQIVEIKEEAGTTPVERVYSDSSYFRFESYQAANLDYGALQSADLIVLNGLPRLEGPLEAALLEYEEAGGSLLFIPSTEGMPATASLAAEGGLALQQANLQEQVRLSAIPSENPFFEGIFEEAGAGFDMPRAQAVVSWSGNREDLLTLQTGAPFLSKSGDVYLLSTPLEPSLTNFHQHALFVPVMYKIAFNSLELDNRLYQTTDDNFIQLQLDELRSEELYKLKQGEQVLIPDQRITNRTLLMELPSYVVETGFYQLLAGEQQVYQLAFNHDARESLTNQLDLEELEGWAETNPQLQLIGELDTNNLRASVEEKFKGEALWKWALLLALLSLLAEVLLIRFLK